jgi:hypothetical protein
MDRCGTFAPPVPDFAPPLRDPGPPTPIDIMLVEKSRRNLAF